MGWIEKKVGKNLGSEQKSAKKRAKPGKWTKGVRALSDKPKGSEPQQASTEPKSGIR